MSYTLGAGGIFELYDLAGGAWAARACAHTQSPRATAFAFARYASASCAGTAGADLRRPKEKDRRVGRLASERTGDGGAFGGVGERKRCGRVGRPNCGGVGSWTEVFSLIRNRQQIVTPSRTRAPSRGEFEL